MSIPTVATPRLRLRPFTTADAADLHHIFAEPDILLYFPGSGTPDLEVVANIIEKRLAHWADRGYGWWAVEWPADKRLIGWTGLLWLLDTQETEVAYMLSRDYWGQGLATEAAQASVRFGFETLLLETIVGIVHPDNIASQRVLEKAGLAFTGSADYFGAPHYRYEIGRTDYQESNDGCRA